ncbi:MAG: AAA family ATPase, partial [Cyanobacteria bacterium P01_G01_bin.39]
MENDLPAESRDEGKIVNVSIYGGNYNENIHGDYQQNSLDYQAAILQRTLNLRSPYKGLKRFNARDKDLFFGRQKLIDELIEAVNQTNLVLVLGASGSGKSSVVRAGVMPQIESSPDQSCLFTPYRNPFESFYRSLLNPEKNYGMDDAELEFILQGNHDSFEKAIALLQTKQSEWLIFIDQFEELFTLCPNRETRGNFIQGLINLSQDSNHSVKFILAMRSDFLQELATYPQFSRIASLNIHLVADLEEGELRQAIEQPAAQHGVVLEAGLAEEIIRDVRGQAGSLPLLQYTLDLLWQREDMSDRTLNIATYHQLGGVTGALQKHVNEIYQGLPDEQQLATKQILLRLVDVVALEQSEVQRIAVSKRADKSEFTDIQAETVQFLINKSLLVSDDLNQEGSTVEIAHEALLNSWAELKEWINDARNTISLNNRLLEDASRWQELKNQNSPQANDELWSGSKLEKAVELKKDGTFEVVLGGLSDPVNDFIDASIDWRDRERKEKLAAAERLAKANRIAREAAEKLVKESKARLAAEAKARKEAEQAKTEAENAALEAENARKLQEKLKREAQEKVFLEANSNKKLRRRALGLGIISFTAVILGILAFYLNSKSQEEAEAARLEQRAANIKVKLSLGNEIEHLLESLELVGDNQKFNRKWFKLSTNLFPEVQSVLFQAVEESRETSILNGHEDSVLSLSYSPNGKYLVTGSSDRMVRLWDVSSQSLIHTFDGHEDWVMSVDFSHDSKYIASASKDKKVKLWDVKNPKTPIQTFSGHTDVVMSVDFSHDSKYLVSASHDKKVKLWDVAKPEQPIHTFDGHTDVVMSVGFSHDSKYLVSGGLDKKV